MFSYTNFLLRNNYLHTTFLTLRHQVGWSNNINYVDQKKLCRSLIHPHQIHDFVFPEAVVNDTSGENKSGAADIAASQHVMVCALQELGSLVQSLSATASPLIQEASIGMRPTYVLECFFSVFKSHRCDWYLPLA